MPALGRDRSIARPNRRAVEMDRRPSVSTARQFSSARSPSDLSPGVSQLGATNGRRPERRALSGVALGRRDQPGGTAPLARQTRARAGNPRLCPLKPVSTQLQRWSPSSLPRCTRSTSASQFEGYTSDILSTPSAGRASSWHLHLCDAAPARSHCRRGRSQTAHCRRSCDESGAEERREWPDLRMAQSRPRTPQHEIARDQILSPRAEDRSR